MGRKQFKEDWARASEKYAKHAHIKDLQYDSETVQFSFEANGKSISFTLYIADDYPEGTMLYPSEGETQTLNESILNILDDVNNEYSIKFGVHGAQEATKREKQTPAPVIPKKSIRVSMDPDDEEDVDSDLEDYEFTQQLQEEISYVKHLFGADTVSYRTFGTLDLLNLDVHVRYSFVPTVAAAWGIKAELPITVRLHISPSMYLNSLQPPKVEIFQTNQPCGLSTQLSAIIRAFCTAHWTTFAQTKRGPLKLRPSNEPNTKNATATSKATYATSTKIRQLTDMGFSHDISEKTLEITLGDVEQATMLLLDTPNSTSKGSKSAKKAKTPKNAQSPPEDQEYQQRKDIFLQEERDKQEKIFKVDYAEPFLGQLHKYLLHRIPTLNKYCVICDGAHLFASSHLLRPAVCARELCCFAFQSLGVCAGATDGIATQAEVVDLLVCMALAAANSQRHELIFDPYPTVFDPFDANHIVLNPQKKDFAALRKILSNFPSVEEMTLAQEVKDIKEIMDKVDIFAFPLLQWIINSNRAHIEKLPTQKHIKGMNTPHQYVLLTAAPEKEGAFAALKKAHGSTFAFHGSPVENWHCILRVGLKNASGSRLQLHGAAYGSGIYLSPAASMSFGYSTRHAYNQPQSAAKVGGNRFLSSADFHCVALCEVANLPDIKKSGDIWVCPKEDAVITRFFFVFPKGHSTMPTCHTVSNPAFLQDVEVALQINT